MDVLAREAAQRLGTREDGIEVVDGEVERFGGRMWFSGRRRVDHLQRDRAAGEVAARTRLLTSVEPEQLAVEVRAPYRGCRPRR